MPGPLLLLEISGGAAVITIAPPTVPNGTVLTAYSQALTASGGTGPYTYAVTSGTLPAGLTLSTAGVISGIPTDVGASTFTVTATDANTDTGSATYTLTVEAVAIIGANGDRYGRPRTTVRRSVMPPDIHLPLRYEAGVITFAIGQRIDAQATLIPAPPREPVYVIGCHASLIMASGPIDLVLGLWMRVQATVQYDEDEQIAEMALASFAFGQDFQKNL